MNVLKNVSITGDVFGEYAFLTYAMSFDGGDGNVSAEYVFSLPSGAYITSFKIYSDGKTVNSKIISAVHASMTAEGKEACGVLKKVGKCEYMLSLTGLCKGESDILISVYTSIDNDRIILPLTRNGYGGDKSVHTASIRLNIADGAESEVSSPTHCVTVSEKYGGAEVVAENIAADRDFCVDIKRKTGRGFAIAAESVEGGEMLCGIYPRNITFKKPEKLLLIYDGACGFSAEEARLAKSFVFYAALAFDGRCAVLKNGKLITNGYVTLSDASADDLLGKLGEDDAYSDYAEKKHMMKALSGSANVMVMCVTNSEKSIYGDDAYCVSAGNKAMRSSLNVYPSDNVSSFASEAIEFCAVDFAAREMTVTAKGADASIISVSKRGCVTVYASYVGKRPKELVFVCGNQKATEQISDVKVYESYSPPGLVYADKRVKYLEKKLMSCSAEEISVIRKEIEKIGIKYSFLNSETSLFVQMGTKRAVLKTVIPNSAERAFGPPRGTSSLLGEKNAVVPSELFVKSCIAYIVQNIRADGAVCGGGELNRDMRKLQTEICIMALFAAEEQIDIGVIRKAEAFLNKKLKADAEEAKLYLRKVFKEPSYIPENEVPDLITAAKAVWQSVEYKKHICNCMNDL